VASKIELKNFVRWQKKINTDALAVQSGNSAVPSCSKLFIKSCQVDSRTVGRRVSANVLGLCEEAELESQMFVLAQMFIRIPNVQFSTEPAFLQNPC